jgi:hypothetical protein
LPVRVSPLSTSEARQLKSQAGSRVDLFQFAVVDATLLVMVETSGVGDAPPPSEPPPSSGSGPRVTREEVDEKLRSQPWELLSKELCLFAMRQLYGPEYTIKQEAHDFAQEAILRARDPKHKPWNFRKQPSLWKFLIGIVLRLITHKYHSQAFKSYAGPYDESEGGDAGQSSFRVAGPYVDAEVQLLGREEERIKGEMLREVRARLEQEQDALAVAVMTLFEQEVDTAAQQATRMGVTEEEIRNARKRLHRVGVAVMAARNKVRR